jgi:hypothetical protein
MDNITTTEIPYVQLAVSEITIISIIGALIFSMLVFCCFLCLCFNKKGNSVVPNNRETYIIDIPPAYLVTEENPPEYRL